MNLAKMIDQTLLKANATADQIEELCNEAADYGFASVCINPGYVPLAARLLQGSGVKVCTVVGFPLGANTPETKIFEARNALHNGAGELDYVINVGHVLDGRFDLIEREMEHFTGLKAEKYALEAVKVILETCYLSDGQIIGVCELAKKTGLDFVKTSTGFGTAGAKPGHVRLMRRTVGPDLGVKASGGIRTYEDALLMIEAGATRIGTSSGVEIISGCGRKGL